MRKARTSRVGMGSMVGQVGAVLAGCLISRRLLGLCFLSLLLHPVVSCKVHGDLPREGASRTLSGLKLYSKKMDAYLKGAGESASPYFFFEESVRFESENTRGRCDQLEVWLSAGDQERTLMHQEKSVERIEGKGAVEIHYFDKEITADQVSFWPGEGRALFQGRACLSEGGRRLNADRIHVTEFGKHIWVESDREEQPIIEVDSLDQVDRLLKNL